MKALASLSFASCLRAREARGSVAQRAGLYYEKQVVRWFATQRLLLAEQPTLHYRGKVFYPDLLVFSSDAKQCKVIEVKNQFVPEAIPQVKRYAEGIAESLPFCEVSWAVICNQVTAPIVDVPIRLLSELFTREAVFVLPRRRLRGQRGWNGLKSCGKFAPGIVRQSRSAGNDLRAGCGLSGLVTQA